MGKNLKGKELGEGISQRSDGYYVARFRSWDQRTEGFRGTERGEAVDYR